MNKPFLFYNSLVLLSLLVVVLSAVESELKKDIEDVKNLKLKSKITACISLIRNSLHEGTNEHMQSTIRNSHFDKSKTYDKVIYLMLTTCTSKIKEANIDFILSPDNILKKLSEEYTELIVFNDDFLKESELDFSNEEKNLRKAVQEASSSEANENIEEEIGLFGIKLSQYASIQYWFVIFALGMTSFIVFGGLYTIYARKQEKLNEKAAKKKKKKKKRGDVEKEE